METNKKYKKCECLKCGNIFPSKAKYQIYCVNGIKKGCRSTIIKVLEDTEPIEEQQEVESSLFF